MYHDTANQRSVWLPSSDGLAGAEDPLLRWFSYITVAWAPQFVPTWASPQGQLSFLMALYRQKIFFSF